MSRGESYEKFVEKFKPKKTTDDCYTPPAVYEAVKSWAINEYGLQGRKIERPFYPGGDYENYIYDKNGVVIDNPPFSILKKIVNFYNSQNIKYFLFAPGLTLFGYCINNEKTCAIIISSEIIYENGAKVQTGFITNLDKSRVRTAPELNQAIKYANNQFIKSPKKKIIKKEYPENITSSALLNKIAKVPFELKNEDLKFTRKAGGVALYGCGAYISSRKAAELKAAELKAAGLKAAGLKEIITLSEQEQKIINELDQKTNGLRKSKVEKEAAAHSQTGRI